MKNRGDNTDVAFYTICDSRYFIGLVALLNSLQLVGHNERVVVLDCGLDDDQKSLISAHCQLVKPPPESFRNPATLKPFLLESDPCRSDIAVLIDSDIIVTRHLGSEIDIARAGKLCGYADYEDHRWFAEWATIFPIRAPLRRGIYVCSCFLVFSRHHWPNFSKRWWDFCRHVLNAESYQENSNLGGPVAQMDQDPLNALLMSDLPDSSFQYLPLRDLVQSSFHRNDATYYLTTVTNERTLECAYGDNQPAMLHWSGKSKPWLWQTRKAWASFEHSNAYVVLLRRLLTSDDVAIKIPDERLPLRLRRGVSGTAAYLSQGIIGQLAQESLFVARRLRTAKTGRQT